MAKRWDCLCVGVTVADAICDPVTRLPAAGEILLTPRISLSVGGCAANVAVDLVKLGLRSALIARVGTDPFGQFVQNSMTASGVDTSRVLQSAEQPTSGTLVINVCGEDRRFIHSFGANALFDGTEVSAELLTEARVLYVGGFCLMKKLTGRRLVELFQSAREAGVTTVLDVVVPDPEGWQQELAEVLPWTDVFLPNTDEALLLTGLTDPVEQAERFRKLGATTVVITCGAQGAVLIGPTARLKAGAFRVEYVDGTGSGDAFVAGYVQGLLEDKTPAQCLEFGTALGASCVRKAGSSAGVFTRPELDEFLQREKLKIESC